MTSQRYDFVILGAGVTGLAAAMYGARLGLKTLVLGSAGDRSAAQDIGGTITTTDVVENYPGFIRLTGEELAQNLEAHARSYDKVTIETAWITSIDKRGNNFYLHAKDKIYSGSALLFATGTRHKELKVPGHDEFRNKGVHYCALCDGPLFRGKIVGVVGGSDSAAKEALFMAEHAAQVFLIARGNEIKAEPINKDRLEKNSKITIVTNRNIVRIEGEKKATRFVLDAPYEGNDALTLDALFVAIGVIPLSDLSKPLGVDINEKGEILIDRDSRTNVKGVYGAGDVCDREFKQAITGVAEGVVASYSAFQDITGGQVCACDDDEIHPAAH